MLFSNARRAAAAIVIAALAVLFAPAPAGAKIIELGQSTAVPADPDCPGSGDIDPVTQKPDVCNAITRTTGYQVSDTAGKDPFLVPRDGRIVAWTIGLSKPAEEEAQFFESSFGGPARAGISVIAQQEKGSTVSEVVANSAVRSLTPYFGKRVQFPLVESLPVEKGQRVALTVPTWAPAFVDGVDKKTAWRASRVKGDTTTTTGPDGETIKTNGCSDVSSQTALLGEGSFAPFQCYYRRARIAYSVTMVTEPREARKKGGKGKGKPDTPTTPDVRAAGV